MLWQLLINAIAIEQLSIAGVLLDDLLVAEDLAAAETTSSALHHAASAAASSPVSPPPSISKQPEAEKPVESEASLTDKSVVMASPVGAPLNGDAIMDISTENALSHGHRYVNGSL
jgi:hypothetical protein